MLIGKSLHIDYEELRCRDGTPYPSGFICDGRIIELVVMFEKVRALYNKPVVINSAYRTHRYNKEIGGSPNSQHMLGKALDIKPPTDIPINIYFKLLKSKHRELGIRGLGKYPTFIHCDIRDSEELVVWG